MFAQRDAEKLQHPASYQFITDSCVGHSVIDTFMIIVCVRCSRSSLEVKDLCRNIGVGVNTAQAAV